MSNTGSKTLTISVMQKEFQVACPEGEEESLLLGSSAKFNRGVNICASILRAIFPAQTAWLTGRIVKRLANFEKTRPKPLRDRAQRRSLNKAYVQHRDVI